MSDVLISLSYIWLVIFGYCLTIIGIVFKKYNVVTLVMNISILMMIIITEVRLLIVVWVLLNVLNVYFGDENGK